MSEEKKTYGAKAMYICASAMGLGFVNSIYLLYLHLGKTSSVLCKASSSISCNVLFNENYSEWFGVPVPVYSVAFYAMAIVAVIYILIRKPSSIRAYAYLYLLSIVGLVTTLYFAGVSLLILKTICPFCAILYAVNILFWWFARKQVIAFDQPWFYLIKEDIPSGIAKPWFVAATAAFGLSFFIGNWFASKEISLSNEKFNLVGEAERSLGNDDSPFVIIEFSDFQCPACRYGGGILKSLQRENPAKVKLVYKFFPLDHKCNPIMKQALHEYACQASRASFCASAQGKFWRFHDVLFENQENINAGIFDKIVKALQMDEKSFEACMASPASLEAVKKDIAEGQKLNIQGTPSVYINGQRYKGKLTLSDLTEALK